MDSRVFVLGTIQTSFARNILTDEKCVACFSPKWSSFLSWPLSGLLHKMQLRHWQVFKSGEKCLISCLVLVPLSFAKTSQGESSYVRLFLFGLQQLCGRYNRTSLKTMRGAANATTELLTCVCVVKIAPLNSSSDFT